MSGLEVAPITITPAAQRVTLGLLTSFQHIEISKAASLHTPLPCAVVSPVDVRDIQETGHAMLPFILQAGMTSKEHGTQFLGDDRPLRPSTPSSSVSSWFTTRSVTPVESCPRLGAMASNSSKKSTHGAAALARLCRHGRSCFHRWYRRS